MDDTTAKALQDVIDGIDAEYGPEAPSETDRLIMGTFMLLQARRQSGMSQDQVAIIMKVHPAIVADIEALDEDSPLALVLRYAEAIGVEMKVEIELPNNKSAMRSLDEGRDTPNGLST